MVEILVHIITSQDIKRFMVIELFMKIIHGIMADNCIKIHLLGMNGLVLEHILVL